MERTLVLTAALVLVLIAWVRAEDQETDCSKKHYGRNTISCKNYRHFLDCTKKPIGDFPPVSDFETQCKTVEDFKLCKDSDSLKDSLKCSHMFGNLPEEHQTPYEEFLKSQQVGMGQACYNSETLKEFLSVMERGVNDTLLKAGTDNKPCYAKQLVPIASRLCKEPGRADYETTSCSDWEKKKKCVDDIFDQYGLKTLMKRYSDYRQKTDTCTYTKQIDRCKRSGLVCDTVSERIKCLQDISLPYYLRNLHRDKDTTLRKLNRHLPQCLAEKTRDDCLAVLGTATTPSCEELDGYMSCLVKHKDQLKKFFPNQHKKQYAWILKQLKERPCKDSEHVESAADGVKVSVLTIWMSTVTALLLKPLHHE